MIKMVSLFSGVGGIDLGFEQTGKFETILANEIDDKASLTYQSNFNNKLIVEDIRNLKKKDFPKYNVLLSGFPCTSFSIAGYRKGFEDENTGDLFFETLRIIVATKPRVVFLENVKNLVGHDNGKTFKKITEILENMGYKVYSEIINSKNFGVPQNRERVYIVAFRKNIDSSNFIFPRKKDDSKKIIDILEKKEVSPKYYLSDVYLECLRKHKQRHKLKGNGFGYEIRDKNEIARTLVCGGIGRERNLIVDEKLTNFKPVTNIKGKINREFIRKLTPREWARLQGFPDDFKLIVADTHLYKQLGNTVTVTVIEAIAENIKKILDNNY